MVQRSSRLPASTVWRAQVNVLVIEAAAKLVDAWNGFGLAAANRLEIIQQLKNVSPKGSG